MTKPTAPDEEFATRFATASSYGFYMQMTPHEEVHSVIDHPERWVVFNLNPQNITWREPVATAITPTQGGGKVIESRGGILKHGQVSGTTGYLPPGQHSDGGIPTFTPGGSRASLVDESDPDLDLKLGVKSGFYKFHKLRHLFRLYMWERRRGNTKVTLHYMDFKHSEFWRVEPTDFTLRRSAKKPFCYDYDINFTAIEPSETMQEVSFVLDAAVDAVLGLTRKGTLAASTVYDNTQVSIERIKTLRESGLGYVQHLSGSVQRLFQNTLLYVSKVTQFFDDVYSIARTGLDLPITLLKQTRGALHALSDVVEKFAPDNIKEELNGWWLEMIGLVNDITVTVLASEQSDAGRLSDDFRVGKAKQGFQTDLLQESSSSLGSIDGPGLEIDVTDSQLKAIPVIDGDTIWSIAQRVFGDISRFVDLVVINNLNAPYIVSNKNNKPTGTVAWGESLLVPATTQDSLVAVAGVSTTVPTYSGVCTATGVSTELIDTAARTLPWQSNQWAGYTLTLRPGSSNEERRVVLSNNNTTMTLNHSWNIPPAVNDSYTLTLVILADGRPLSPDARAYGRDILLAFKRSDVNYARSRATCVLNTRGDLATVAGMDNVLQAVQIRAETELRTHPFHLSFGVALPIGRPWSESTNFLYTYFARRSFLQDPRIASVKNVAVVIRDGILRFSAEVQPVHSQKTSAVTVAAR